MSSKEAKKILRKERNKHNIQHEECEPEFFQAIYPRTDAAIRNSREILKDKGWGEDLRNCNPSTHVHKVVTHLQDIAKM